MAAVAASGCALPEMPETWNKQLFLQERPFFSSLEVGRRQKQQT